MEAFAKHAEAQAAVEQKVAAAEPVKAALPDMPAHLVRCVQYGLSANAKQLGAAKKVGKGKAKDNKANAQKGVEGPKTAQGTVPSADEVVLARLQTAEERHKCAVALMSWYRSVQAANKAAPKKG
jgi:hypothetical protein